MCFEPLGSSLGPMVVTWHTEVIDIIELRKKQKKNVPGARDVSRAPAPAAAAADPASAAAAAAAVAAAASWS
jgi:hypothetical protein